ncbi:hypothetical protein ES708_14672 [subsurface metagenome]
MSSRKEYQKEYNKQYRKDNAEKIREYYKKRKEKIRQYVQDYKILRGCKVCGYNKCASALEFHHNGDKEFNVATYVQNCISIETIEREMEKCEVLCANCHREWHEKIRRGKL